MNEVAKKENAAAPAVQPACTISEANGKVRLRLEMPGVDKTGLEVSVEKNELVIVGKTKQAEPAGTYLLRERRRGEFRKRFIIDETIDRETIEAAMQDGVLQMTLALKEAAKPRKIAIA